MDCLWIKQGSGLFPADPVTAELLAGIGQGQHVRTSDFARPRNPDFHKLMMAGLSQIVANTYPRFADVDAAMIWLKLKSGMVDHIKMDGENLLVPQSVSFSKMDQIQFKAVSEQWREIALEEFGIDLLRERNGG